MPVRFQSGLIAELSNRKGLEAIDASFEASGAGFTATDGFCRRFQGYLGVLMQVSLVPNGSDERL
jgi:hypothetical protein